MLSILSGILGFATSGLPSILGFFQQKGDQKHEREMAKLQTERELGGSGGGGEANGLTSGGGGAATGGGLFTGLSGLLGLTGEDTLVTFVALLTHELAVSTHVPHIDGL